jgi:exopolyphosphatase/pppGpp-phosphohydrolase
MNTKNDGFGEIKTVINNDNNIPTSIAVIELSTKAVKMLIGELDKMKSKDFNFKSFKREGWLTNTGKGLDAKNNMNLDFFKSNIIPILNHFVDVLSENNVDIVYTVATAAIRSAENNEYLLKIIKDECGLNVKILTKEEEAKATLDAFMLSASSYINNTDQRFILVDQGGGSTEITLFEKGKILQTYSLDLGTVVLENILFLRNHTNTNIRKAFCKVDRFIDYTLMHYFKNHAPKPDNCICVGVGTAITRATGKVTNRYQHGTKLTMEFIENKIITIEDKISEEYKNVGSVYENIYSVDVKKSNYIEELIAIRVGLYMYKEIMRGFNINEILVSGTGLWYGVYYQKYKEIGLR